jgi:hypothetical protein
MKGSFLRLNYWYGLWWFSDDVEYGWFEKKKGVMN